MLRVAEQYAATDTGRQRRANEDALLSRSPLFVVADGMGGAQAGEVASQLAVEAFKGGLDDSPAPEEALARLAQEANTRIHERAHSHSEQAGMGTTLTALYAGPQDVAIAHVGDSRAYCWRAGELIRLTEDHSLVDELMRQGRLTPEEAEEHPQRSVITRALGPELDVEVDTRSFRARAGDVYLLCSDGLTTMVSEDEIAALLREHSDLRGAGEALIAAANRAGGRDNITVVLLRIEEVRAATAVPGDAGAATPGADGDATRIPDGDATRIPDGGATRIPDGGARAPASKTRISDDGDGDGDGETAATVVPSLGEDGASELEDTIVRAPARQRPVARRLPRRPPAPSQRGARKRVRVRHAGALVATLAILGLVAGGAYVALTSVYFIGTNARGLVTLYRGVPFKLPGNIALYSSDFVSGVSASTVAPGRRHALLDHSLRSEGNAGALIRSLELGQLE
jgi:PPM family protein phosphatase